MAQGVVVVLPQREYTFEHGAPFEGSKQFFSGNRDDLNSTMTRTLDFTGKSSASLSMKGRYDIEAGYDYLFEPGKPRGSGTQTKSPDPVYGRHRAPTCVNIWTKATE